MNAGVARAAVSRGHPELKPMTRDPTPIAVTRATMMPPATTTRRSCEPERLGAGPSESLASSCRSGVLIVSVADRSAGLRGAS